MMHRTLFLSLLTSLLFSFSYHSKAQGCLNLQIATANVLQGGQVCLPVTVSNFDDIIGFQFSVNWDDENLTYADLIELNPDIGISLSNFGTPATGLAEGTLTVSWISPTLTPVSIGDNEALFSICLDVIGDESLVTFSESPTPFEFLDENLEELPAGFLNGKVSGIEPTDLIRVDEICADILTCTNSSTTLTATIFGGSLPYTYLWDGPNGYFASDESPVVNESGIYKLLVTDSEGYVASALYDVKENIEDDIISSVNITNASCSDGDDGSISIEVNGDPNNFAFVWSNGANTSSIEDLTPGTYSVTILDWNTACALEETYTVAEEGFLTAFSYECEFLPDTTMATITSVVWTGGLTPYTFAWSTGDTTVTASGVSSIYVGADGTYSLTITDANGCEEVYNDIVADCQGETPLGVDVTYECMEDQGAIQVEIIATPTTGNAPYTFEWSDGTMTTTNGADTIVLNYPGNFGVTVTDADGLSYEEGSLDVDCSAFEDFVTATSYNCQVFDDSTVVELSLIVWAGGTQPYTFEWSNGFTEVDSFITTNIYTCPGTFDLTITDATGASDVLYGLTDDCDCGGTSDEVVFNVSSAFADVGDQVCVDVSVDNFTDILATQFSINYDTNILEFESVGNFGLPSLNEDVMGLPGVIDPGNITVSWIDPTLNGVSIPDGTVLFEICFNALAEGTAAVAVTGNPIPIEVVDSNSEIVETSQNDGGVIVSDSNGNNFTTASTCNTLEFPDSTVNELIVIVWGGGVQPYTFEWSNGYTAVDSFSTTTNFDCQDFYSLTITDATGVSDVLTDLGEECGCSGNTDDVSINISSADVEVGDQFCVDVTVDNFNEIIGIQGTIEWDETLVSFDEVNNLGLLGTLAFGTNNLTDNGKLTYTWVDPDLSGETFADGAALFELCFTAIANGSSFITPGNDPTIIEFIDVNNELVPYTANQGLIQVGNPNELIVGISYECIDYVDSLDINITAVSWNGTPPFTFEWSTGTTEVSNFQSVVTVHDDSAVYGLTVTDAQGLTYINDNIEPICGSTQAEFITGTSCETTYYEDSTVVDLTMVVWGGGTPPYTFDWSNGFTESDSLSSTLTYTCPGTYSLTITDSDGYSEIFENISDNCNCGSIEDGEVQLSIDDAVGETGDQVCVSVRAELFNDIMGFQYTMYYDPNLIELATVEPKDLPGLTINAFGFISPGVVTMSWINPSLTGVTLNQGTALYEMCFDITGSIGSVAEIEFAETPTIIEFINANSEVVSFSGTDGSITIAENVWPGDADNNELVTNVDLLNIGLGYGQMGPARPETGTDWQGYGAYDWTTSTPNSNVNYKNADANGDGIISALDANAILDNYGEETNFWDGNDDQFNFTPQNNLMSPPIFVMPDTVIPGSVVEFPIIMGSEDFPASDIYGIAFTILYDPEVVVPESAFATFGTSWVGLLDDNMLGLHKDFHDNGKIDIAITRTDGMNVSGSGQIGSLHLTIEDVILRSTLYPVEFEVVDIKVIRNDEQLIEITPKNTTMIIDVVNNINEVPLEEAIQVYPNPTNDHLFINANSVNIQQISIYSVDGSMVPVDYERTNELSLKNLPNGVYLLKVLTDRGMVNKRIVKQGQ